MSDRADLVVRRAAIRGRVGMADDDGAALEGSGLAGNPAILGTRPRTGGFASPPRGGFAFFSVRPVDVAAKRPRAKRSFSICDRAVVLGRSGVTRVVDRRFSSARTGALRFWAQAD